MAKKDLTDKLKEGVSVEEIEKLARKYTTEGFLLISFIVATISSIIGFFTGPGWSLTFAGFGAILGFALPKKIEIIEKNIIQFIYKQTKTAEIIIGVIRLILAIFMPFIIFAEIGLLAGMSIQLTTRQLNVKKEDEEPSNK
jgi:hypothetical protein